MLKMSQHLLNTPPETDPTRFQVHQLPLLDVDRAIALLGDRTILTNMLHMMIHEQVPHDLPLLKSAYQQHDWKTIESLAHKMKAGALYCGTVRLQMACQYLEVSCKAGETEALDQLYHQLIQTIEETCREVP